MDRGGHCQNIFDTNTRISSIFLVDDLADLSLEAGTMYDGLYTEKQSQVSEPFPRDHHAYNFFSHIYIHTDHRTC